MLKFILFSLCFSFFPLLSQNSIHFPSRKEQLNSVEYENFDLLVIGGGASGVGIAYEGATRGLKVLLVEKSDFASQTSSKSTKLIHGGVRYLEKAVLNLDRNQYALVKEALHERGTLMRIAPYGVKPVKLITPIYNFFQLPYMWVGLKMYDLISGSGRIGSSHYVSAKKIKETFPYVKSKGLVGGVSYYDGQFDDTRLHMMVLLSAVNEGAFALNYTEVTSFIKEEGIITGAYLFDHLSKRRYAVRAKVCVNATGPFSDKIRKLDNPDCQERMVPSAGTHLLLKKDYTSHGIGMLIPKTRDGRLLFLLPWKGQTLAGTTDSPSELIEDPKPTSEEVDYILSYLKEYLDTDLTKEDVQASWTGLRPLVRDPNVESTSKLCRNHCLEISDSKLVSIMGGKWTTFRKMAQDTIDFVARETKMDVRPSISDQKLLLGAEGYDSNTIYQLKSQSGLDMDICQHLIESYGTLAFLVIQSGKCERLHPDHPYISAELDWAVKNEYALGLTDLLYRRTRIAMLDERGTFEISPTIASWLQEKNYGIMDLKYPEGLLSLSSLKEPRAP